MGTVVLQKLPGRICVAWGGTRTLVRLDRPWQADLYIDPHACPFHKRDDSELERFDTASGWRLLLNKHTPFPWHRLLVPGKCWSKRRLRSLGGPEEIECVLNLTQRVIGSSRGEFWLGVHVGASAGQNIGHVHYHLLKPLRGSDARTDDSVIQYCRSLRTVVFELGNLRVVLGGVRSGQCFIVPVLKKQSLSLPKLADGISRIIELFNDKFRSIQGLPPDYMVAVRFVGQSAIYASYVPILNNWGFTEYLGLLEGTPLILPWPHKATAMRLRQVEVAHKRL